MTSKTELIAQVAKNAKITKKSAAAGVEAVLATIQENLVKGNKVQLIGFGSFEVHERPARKGRNPQNGEEVEIPARKVPVFKPGRGLKTAVKNS
ncbi:HU family DNA-binding protein (plasmid) [Lactobacillus sp. ESL0731]|uniref:HU family DNA-binding protein n=1 Tax=unclassified Lactobacillus TaxID=2620435 RepID=UPI0023F746D4|nr:MULTISPECIES: HU family DNA-binding protein [unclassified Lactobacillus]WEV52089.1 HU family DNA-binding protein [Lactobacillus sp. ESL0700]WEV63220.1 HU family DNA-binding protein [Lactobacillus sp. ESL0731]